MKPHKIITDKNFLDWYKNIYSTGKTDVYSHFLEHSQLAWESTGAFLEQRNRERTCIYAMEAYGVLAYKRASLAGFNFNVDKKTVVFNYPEDNSGEFAQFPKSGLKVGDLFIIYTNHSQKVLRVESIISAPRANCEYRLMRFTYKFEETDIEIPRFSDVVDAIRIKSNIENGYFNTRYQNVVLRNLISAKGTRIKPGVILTYKVGDDIVKNHITAKNFEDMDDILQTIETTGVPITYGPVGYRYLTKKERNLYKLKQKRLI